MFVWGDYPLWAHCMSMKGRTRSGLAPIGMRAADESVFGVRDLAGSLSEPTTTAIYDKLYVLRGGSRETLFPDPATPIDSSEIRYQVSLGFQDGEVVWSDPEKIGLDQGGSQVVYKKNPDTPEETRSVWCKLVRPFFGGESSNGVDDNGNGLVDEKGLSFTLQGDQVKIRLTLERQQSKGPALIKTVETTVTIRN